MNVFGWALVIFLTAMAVMLGFAWLLGRGLRELDRVRLLDQLDQAVAVAQLPRAGLLPLHHLPETGPSGPWLEPDPYGPFPDTGPLLILSEKAAANAALEREIPRLCAEAEAKIPPRWR